MSEEKQEPVQLTAENFMQWAEGLKRAGIAVEIERPSTESFHEKYIEDQA